MFEKMYSTSIMSIVFTVGMIFFVGGGLYMLNDSPLIGIALLVFGGLGWRLICECGIVLFRIYEDVHAILKLIEKKLPETKDQTTDKKGEEKQGQSQTPTYCERCQKDYPDADSICPKCGEKLTLDQTYFEKWLNQK